MLRRTAQITLFVAFIWASTALFSGSAFAQSQVNRSDQQKEVATEQEPNLKSEVDTLKAENAVVRELLRRMEEQQNALLVQVDRLQRRLDSVATTVERSGGLSYVADAGEPLAPEESLAHDANAPVAATRVENASAQQASIETQGKEDRYQDGIVIWQNAEGAKVPFLLRFNNNTQVRYLNTLNSSETFTDHLGNVREVHRRNDITVNRSMFIFAGYMFDPKLQYSLTVWTSAGAARSSSQAILAGDSTTPLPSLAGIRAFQAADHLSTRSHSFNRPIGAWRTISSAPVLLRESG
jgi:hypothetical protein